MRKFLLLATFFSATPFVCLVAIALLSLMSTQGKTLTASHHQSLRVAFAALPSTQNTFEDTIVSADSRTELLRQFFARYHSPLEPFAAEFVKKAEEYKLDFRLLPAIAMQESNLCLKSQPDSYNCWGFGVYGGKYLYFDSYPQAIDTITKALALRYKNAHGLVTPDEIQKMYTPSSDGSWAYSVNHFMDSLQ